MHQCGYSEHLTHVYPNRSRGAIFGEGTGLEIGSVADPCRLSGGLKLICAKKHRRNRGTKKGQEECDVTH